MHKEPQALAASNTAVSCAARVFPLRRASKESGYQIGGVI